MENTIAKLSYKFDNLIKSDFITFEEVSKHKNITGVYLIYETDDRLLYIGNTNKFNIRFNVDLKHESTHTLVRKLLKSDKFIERKEVVNYLMRNCKMRIEICESKREAEALEGIAIYLLNPEFNKY